MDALAGLVRDRDKPLGRLQRRTASRHTGCERGSPSTRKFLRSFSAVFVLGMERGAAADRLAAPRVAVIILDQQRAGG